MGATSRWLLGLLVLSTCTVALAEEDISAMTRQVDARIAAGWAKAGVAPVAAASDAEFLRRVSLDLTGVIPSVGEVRAFLGDTQPEKRARLVDALLIKPSHATHRATLWRDLLIPSSGDLQRFSQTQFFTVYLRDQFAPKIEVRDGKSVAIPADKVSYDAFVRDLLTASGQLNQTGPVAYYTSLELKPEELAASTSKVFLGVQIQCAQCHQHPFDHWSQQDFWGFAAFFAQLQRPPAQQPFAFQVADTPMGEVFLPDTQTPVAPKFLGVEQAPPSGETRRQQLALWLTSRENPYFARATVNRVWAQLFGRGLVEPVDDFGAHNRPSHPELLDELAADFAGDGFDLRRLYRVLTNTQAYQLSSLVPVEGEPAPELFARMAIKSLTAKQIYDCLQEATRRRENPAANPQARNFGFIQEEQAFLSKFEAPTQTATEFQAGIPQALTLMNGALIANATDVERSDLLAALLDAPFFTDEERIETLFLATYSRLPTEAERQKCVEHLKGGGAAGDRRQGFSDVLWALLNSAEFILNH